MHIANIWSDLLGLQGDTNRSLAAGICGYLFAVGGDLLSAYTGWAPADKQAYQEMMMRVFYPENFDFLWRHHDTFWRNGGNTHYRLNWDTANMASMAAIGVLCDNRAVYEQAIDFFKYGPGNGRIERAAWYIHPNGLAQSEEIGRDQGHNLIGWYQMALLCQTAWNQGDDLWAYNDNLLLRALEHITKWNLWQDVPWVYHRNCDLAYTETLSESGRGALGVFHEMAYNHYVNIKGMAAPYTKAAAEMVRPERWPNTGYHPSEVDWFGHGTLTFSLDPIASGRPPSGLQAHWSKNQVVLNWWGSAYAEGYTIKRAFSLGGPYASIGSVGPMDTTFTDSNVVNGTAYYYIVASLNPDGEKDSDPLEVAQRLMTGYPFDGNAADSQGSRDGVLKGGSTGAATFTTGKIGQAIKLDGVDDYVQLPAGVGNYQDITVAAWVYWNGGGNWQRIFDFGTEIEKSMFLTPSNGVNMRFSITTSRGAEGTGDLNGPVMPINQWTHTAVTLNGDVAALYVNGAPVDTKVIDKVDPLFGQVYCYIGKSMWNADPLFKGCIDDFRIYNYALSGSEIWRLWGQSSNRAPEFFCDPLDLPDALEDAAYTGQSLLDYISDSDGDPLTFSKITGPSWLSVAADGTLSGTPANDDVGPNIFVVWAKDPSGAVDNTTLRITVINVNDPPNWVTDPFSKDNAVQDQPYSGALAFDAEDIDIGDLLTFSKISGPSWLHVSADGTLSGTPDSGDVGQNVFIVRVADSSGAYDEATLTIQVEGKGLRARYEFEGSAYDSTGFYHGTTTGSPAYLSGQFGQAINLDGVDDFVTLPAKVASNLNAVTVSAWINWDGGSAWQRIFDFGNGTSQYLFLTPSNGSVMRFAVKNGGSEQTLSASPPAVGQWVHVAIALNGSVGTLYVNGSPKATHSSMTIRPSDFNPSQNYIGKSQFSADPLFDGRIDDFRIYNYALSSSEIAAVYAASLLPPPPHFDGTAVSASRIDLSWDAVPGAAGYKIARSTASGGPYESVDDSAIGTTCSDTDLLGNLTYYYVIASVNEIGPGAYSPEIAVTTLPGQPTPWQGIVRPIPGQIEAEYYDDGGQNVSYYDTTPGNSGGQFSRIYGGVDLFASSDVGGGYAVGDIQSGEWLLYTVTSSASEVSLYARLASLQSGNQIRVLLDDVPLAVVEVPNTGSLSAWATVSVEGVSLPDSSHALLKLEFTGSDFRVNWVAFQSQSPYLGYPSALPGRIQFEDFDSGGQNISYYDTTAGNTYEEYRSDEDVDIMSVPGGYGVYMSPGEWMEYTCTSEPGLYTMSIRHASNQKTQTLRLSDESAVLAEVELPKTGGYSNWQDTLVSDVFLSGGQGHILRFTMAASTALLDYVDFIRQENPADFDGSGFVDLEDFSILSSQWLREPSEPSADAAPQGGDNWVDLQDLIA
ncbi:MAG TPA: DUF5010 C-terminal domain-containing protein, partial [Anaerohalosphaeraceae bacterium]|nr:DUF5010 C-terminal domain-containing protein [Anaerohalosphaeraceae bacterium]